MRLQEQKRDGEARRDWPQQEVVPRLRPEEARGVGGAGREGNGSQGAWSELVLGKKNLEPLQPE